MSLRPPLKRPQRLTVKRVYLVVTWDHDGYLTKTWVEGKVEAERVAEHCRDDRHFKSVAGPLGPFVLDQSADTISKDAKR